MLECKICKDFTSKSSAQVSYVCGASLKQMCIIDEIVKKKRCRRNNLQIRAVYNSRADWINKSLLHISCFVFLALQPILVVFSQLDSGL